MTRLTWWEQWRGVVCFLVFVVVTSVFFWHSDGLSDRHFVNRYPFSALLLGIGLLFDLLSCACYISARVTGRSTSGLPGVGFAFYLWAWLACPASIILSTPDSLPLLWIYKLLDLVVLFLLSALILSPGWLAFFHFKRHNS